VAYMIVPGAKGPKGETLALNAADDGSIVVGNAEFATAGMWWSLIYDFNTENFAMVNVGSLESGTPAVLALEPDDPPEELRLRPLSGGLFEGNTWDVAPGGPALAVRSSVSTSFNLNVMGNGPYPIGNPVITYDGWNGGQPNEVWTFQQLDADDYPYDFAFAPECAAGLCLTANPQAESAQLTIEPPGDPDSHYSPAQLWSSIYVIDGTTPLGAVFINAETVQAVCILGDALVTKDLGQLDASAAWLTGAGPDTGTTMIRSIANQNLYWNVEGGGPYGPGNPVIAWPFQGGAQNEQWYVRPVPHEVTSPPRRLRLPMLRGRG